MKNLDNNFNVNNNKRAYSPNLKKNDELTKPVAKFDDATQEMLVDGSKAADAYGRILVKPSSIDSTTPVQSVIDSLDFLNDNYETALASMKAVDDAYELLIADDVDCAYEKACCGAIDAAYSKNN